MAGRQKKIEQDKEENIQGKEQNNSNDLFTPENMAKMFAMFKQFQEMEKQSPQEEIKVEKIKKQDTKLPQVFTKSMLIKINNEEVTVRSVIDNVHFVSPKTKIGYTWLNKGDVEALPISEILAMESYSQRFLHTPWLVVEDERVVQALNLGRTYELVEKVEDISELVKLNKEELSQIFNELPRQYQNNFRNEIYKKVRTRELNDLTTIDDLSEILHVRLRDLE